MDKVETVFHVEVSSTTPALKYCTLVLYIIILYLYIHCIGILLLLLLLIYSYP